MKQFLLFLSIALAFSCSLVNDVSDSDTQDGTRFINNKQPVLDQGCVDLVKRLFVIADTKVDKYCENFNSKCLAALANDETAFNLNFKDATALLKMTDLYYCKNISGTCFDQWYNLNDDDVKGVPQNVWTSENLKKMFFEFPYKPFENNEALTLTGCKSIFAGDNVTNGGVELFADGNFSAETSETFEYSASDLNYYQIGTSAKALKLKIGKENDTYHPMGVRIYGNPEYSQPYYDYISYSPKELEIDKTPKEIPIQSLTLLSLENDEPADEKDLIYQGSVTLGFSSGKTVTHSILTDEDNKEIELESDNSSSKNKLVAVFYDKWISKTEFTLKNASTNNTAELDFRSILKTPAGAENEFGNFFGKEYSKIKVQVDKDEVNGTVACPDLENSIKLYPDKENQNICYFITAQTSLSSNNKDIKNHEVYLNLGGPALNTTSRFTISMDDNHVAVLCNKKIEITENLYSDLIKDYGTNPALEINNYELNMELENCQLYLPDDLDAMEQNDNGIPEVDDFTGLTIKDDDIEFIAIIPAYNPDIVKTFEECRQEAEPNEILLYETANFNNECSVGTETAMVLVNSNNNFLNLASLNLAGKISSVIYNILPENIAVFCKNEKNDGGQLYTEGLLKATLEIDSTNKVTTKDKNCKIVESLTEGQKKVAVFPNFDELSGFADNAIRVVALFNKKELLFINPNFLEISYRRNVKSEEVDLANATTDENGLITDKGKSASVVMKNKLLSTQAISTTLVAWVKFANNDFIDEGIIVSLPFDDCTGDENTSIETLAFKTGLNAQDNNKPEFIFTVGLSDKNKYEVRGPDIIKNNIWYALVGTYLNSGMLYFWVYKEEPSGINENEMIMKKWDYADSSIPAEKTLNLGKQTLFIAKECAEEKYFKGMIDEIGIYQALYGNTGNQIYKFDDQAKVEALINSVYSLRNMQ